MDIIKQKILIKLAEFGVIAGPVSEAKLLRLVPKENLEKIKPEIDWLVKNKIDSKPAFYYVKKYKEHIKDSNKLKSLENNKEKIKHFSDLMNTNTKINKYVWDEKLEIDKIINELEEIEKEWQKNLDDEKNKWIKDSEEKNKKEVVKVDSKFSWWDLNTNKSNEESRAMGHCGTDISAKTIISLREEKTENGEKLYLPHLSFSISKDRHLLQMKGPKNQKPHKKYHKAILKLLNSDHVDKLLGGDYKPETDFSIEDLEEGDVVELNEILKQKPDLEFGETLKGINSYEKLQEKLNKINDRDIKAKLKRKWIFKNNDKLSEDQKKEFVKSDSAGIHYIKDPSENLQLLALERYGTGVISLIRTPTEKVQLKAVKKEGEAIKYIKNPNEEMQLEAVKQNGRAIEHIKNPSEDVQLEAVKQEGEAIEYIKNPSEAVQLEAVKQRGTAIKYIKNPTEEMQLAAVKRGWLAIRYIQNPSEEMQLEAVRQDDRAIEYIKNPTEEMQLEAVKQRGWAIQYIKNPSEEIQLAAVKKEGEAIQYIKNPSEAVQLEAVKGSWGAIEYIKNPTEEMQLEAVKQRGRAIRYIENPSEEIQLAAVKHGWQAIQYIENPSEAVQLEAVKQRGTAIKYINNPTEKVKKLDKELWESNKKSSKDYKIKIIDKVKDKLKN
jgi:phosphoribulokinase